MPPPSTLLMRRRTWLWERFAALFSSLTDAEAEAGARASRPTRYAMRSRRATPIFSPWVRVP